MAKIKMTAVSGKGKKNFIQLFDMKQELKSKFNNLPGHLAADKWYEAARKGDYWGEDKFKQVYLEECRKHDYTAAQVREAAGRFGETWKKYFQSSVEALKGTLGVIGDISSGNFTRIPEDAKKAVKGAKEWGQALVDNTKAIGDFITAGQDYNSKKEGDSNMAKTKTKVKNLTRKGFNHPEWYGKYPHFITTNLNYGVRKQPEQFEIAVGARIRTRLTVPQRDGQIAQAYKDMMNALFAKLRGSNSGAFNYDVEDVAAYIETVRGIRAVHAKLVRDINAVNNVDAYIAQTPYPLLKVLGYDATAVNDMILNKATYVARINELGIIIDQTFPVPPDMSVFDRDKYVAETLLEDGKGPKSSIYCYLISKVTGASGTNSSDVKDYTFGTSDYPTQVSDLAIMMDNARQYVSASYPNRDTFAKISGDIFKAYGQAGLSRRVSVADLNSRVEVKFDEYLLHQLQNATSAAFAQGGFDQKLTNASIFNVTYQCEIGVAGVDNTKTIPEYQLPILEGGISRIINTNKSDVTGLETLSLTRGNYTLTPNGTALPYDDTTVYNVRDCSTDCITALSAVYYGTNGTLYEQTLSAYSMQQESYAKIVSSLWSQLDYLPALYIFNEADAGGSSNILLDLDTYAFMTTTQLRQFNDICIMSLYKTVDVSDQVNFRAVKR